MLQLWEKYGIMGYSTMLHGRWVRWMGRWTMVNPPSHRLFGWNIWVRCRLWSTANDCLILLDVLRLGKVEMEAHHVFCDWPAELASDVFDGLYNIVTPKRWKKRGTFHFFWVAIIHGGNSIDRLRASCCIHLSGQRQSFKPSQRQRYREGHEWGWEAGWHFMETSGWQ